MKNVYDQSQFSKALLTSVFVGFIASIICLLFNIIYREETLLVPSDIINVSTLIFGVNLFFFTSGMIFGALRRIALKGEVIYIILFSLLTIFLAWKAEGVSRTHDHDVTLKFRGLLLGVILISGISVSFVVPYLYHNRKFNQHVL